MKMNEVLDVVEFGFKYYRNPKSGNRINLLEYYALTDLTPKQLSKEASSAKKYALNFYLAEFDEQCFFLQRPLDMDARLRLFHAFKGRELTADDKLTIKEKLEQEGFPLFDGVYDLAARYYVESGVDSITKENVRRTIITCYNSAHSFDGKRIELSEEKGAALVK
jgi:hypothetical protein